jgi:hypothetical protein
MDINEVNLPKEWIELIKIAMESDRSKEDFLSFLQREKEKKMNTNNGH